jgi:hypothetical protein
MPLRTWRPEGTTRKQVERLTGTVKGRYSIRINDQWRLVSDGRGDAYEVEIVDYIRRNPWPRNGADTSRRDYSRGISQALT